MTRWKEKGCVPWIEYDGNGCWHFAYYLYKEVPKKNKKPPSKITIRVAMPVPTKEVEENLKRELGITK